MQNTYEVFVRQNRQMLIDTAQEKGITITFEDLSGISGAQLPLDMMDDKFLDALQEGLFSLQDIKQMYADFKEYYTDYPPARPQTTDPIVNSLDSAALITICTENATANLMRQMMNPAYLEALRQDWGSKSEHKFTHDLIDAFNEGRITADDIFSMTNDDLETAISENRYPQDVDYSCH